MKVAIVHEWLIDWAGSERVLEQLVACFPEADVFALVDFLEPKHRVKLRGKNATTSFLQRMPGSRRHIAWYLPLMPIAIEQLDVSAYDVIISSSHAVAKGVLTGPDQLHVSYVHSPMRYAWDLQHEYLRGKAGNGLRGLALRWLLHYLRQWDIRTANSVDMFIANSAFVARRIEKFYRREARILHPPVDVDSFSPSDTKDDFYLCAGRLMPYKRVDIVVDAFRAMPQKRLIISGDGPELKTLRKSAPANVEFTGYQSDQDLRERLRRARALIFPGKEDFGIVPVEAQACGTPVIGYAAGGLLETVRPLGEPDPTGVFFNEQTANAVIEAIGVFERASFAASACRTNAERFAAPRFAPVLKALVERELATRRGGHVRALQGSPVDLSRANQGS
jgi:glycosyltransferase involved in cell wall biosynthesis